MSATTPVLDLSGLMCPHVVLRLADYLREAAPGVVVMVVSTDPLSHLDIPVFLFRNGHRLLAQQRASGQFRFVIERGPITGPDGGDAATPDVG